MLAHSLLSVRCCLLKKYKSFLKVVDWTLYWLILNNTVLTLGLRPPPPKEKKNMIGASLESRLQLQYLLFEHRRM